MNPIQYEDHIGYWEKELKDWVPKKIFDAHVHLGPVEAVGEISPERLKLPLTTFTNLRLEELTTWYEKLYHTKRVEGLIAFPFPLQEGKSSVNPVFYVVRTFQVRLLARLKASHYIYQMTRG